MTHQNEINRNTLNFLNDLKEKSELLQADHSEHLQKIIHEIEKISKEIDFLDMRRKMLQHSKSICEGILDFAEEHSEVIEMFSSYFEKQLYLAPKTPEEEGVNIEEGVIKQVQPIEKPKETAAERERRLLAKAEEIKNGTYDYDSDPDNLTFQQNQPIPVIVEDGKTLNVGDLVFHKTDRCPSCDQAYTFARSIGYKDPEKYTVLEELCVNPKCKTPISIKLYPPNWIQVMPRVSPVDMERARKFQEGSDNPYIKDDPGCRCENNPFLKDNG